jgi:Fe-S cluster assembly iron-binding protein IscA
MRTGASSRRAGASLVVISEPALSQMALLRANQHARPDQGLGLVWESGGRIGLVLDTPDVKDRVFVRDGIPVLFISDEVERPLQDQMIDFEGAPGNEKFTIKRRPTTPE